MITVNDLITDPSKVKVGRPRKRRNPFEIVKVTFTEDGMEEEVIEIKPIKKILMEEERKRKEE